MSEEQQPDRAAGIQEASGEATAPAATSGMGGRLAAGFVLGLVLYAGLALWADLGAMGRALQDFDFWLVPAACGLSLANYLVRFPRWERYRKLIGVRLETGTSLQVYLAGLALTVTPGKMGEAFKSWLIRRVDGTPVHRTAPIVLAERLTDLLGFLVLIAVGGLATQPDHAWIFWGTAAACLLLVAVIASPRLTGLACSTLEHLPVVGRVAHKAQDSFDSARILLAPQELLLPTVLATLGWGLECVGFYLVANGLLGPEATGEVPFLFAVYTFALSAVAGAVMILAPGGLGVTEATLGGLLGARYGMLGMGEEAARAGATSATLLIRLCTLWFAVVVGLVALALFRRRYPALGKGRAQEG